MFNWLHGLVDRCFAVAGAIFLAQAPLFMQQYTQQLIARASELKFQIEALQRAASLSGKTLIQLIEKFSSHTDGDISRQGEAMQALAIRWQHLHEAAASLQESTLWERPFTFLRHLDTVTFSSTVHNYHFGLPLNLEGGAYALVGIAVGYLVFACLRKLFRLFFLNSTTPKMADVYCLTSKGKDNKADDEIGAPKKCGSHERCS